MPGGDDDESGRPVQVPEPAKRPGSLSSAGMGLAASSSEGITELRLSGHLDSASSAGLERRLHDMVTAGATRVIVDLSDVSYVSSGGWGIFVGEVNALRNRGGDIVLTGMTSEVFDVYELLGFADVLRAFTTVAEARTFLSLPSDQRAAKALPVSRELDPDEVASAHGITIDGGATDAPREWQSLRVEATTVGERGEIAVLSLGGIIDTVSAEKLRSALDQVIAGGRLNVVVDMSQVEYVSSGGWGVFTERLREVRRGGGDIKLFGMDPDVYYVFTMLGFNIVLSSFDILGEAIEDFRRPAPAMGEEPDFSISEPETPVVPSPGRVGASVPGMDIVWEGGADGVRVAHLSGVIETTAVSLLSDEIARETAAAPRAIVFDLSGVEYISSSGWGQFARAHEAVGAVALAGMQPDLFDVYECLEFRSFIRAFATEAEAIGAVGGSAGAAPSAPLPPETRPSRRPDSRPTLPDDAAEVLDADAAPPAEGLDGLLDDAPVDPVPPSPADPKPTDWPASRRDTPERPAEPPIWGNRTWSGREAPSGDLDVDSAQADSRVDRDEKLRSIGWKGYGEKLRRHVRPTDDPDAADPHADAPDAAEDPDGDGDA